jgi:hypothetical protein
MKLRTLKSVNILVEFTVINQEIKIKYKILLAKIIIISRIKTVKKYGIQLNKPIIF